MINVTRRKFSRTVAAMPLIGYLWRQPTLDVDIYAGASVENKYEINEAAIQAGNFFEEALGIDVSLGPEGVVEVPDYGDTEALLDWWMVQGESSAEHANVLCVDYDDKMGDILGYGTIGLPYCVVSNASVLSLPVPFWIFIHEITHCLGARHNDASDGTIMNDHWDNVDGDNLRFSEETERIIRRNL